MYITKIKNKNYFQKKIKLELILGLSKPSAKLNLTLAPLNLNVTNLFNEFNNFFYNFYDNDYKLNCILYINNLLNIILLNIKNSKAKEIYNIINNKISNTNNTYLFLGFLSLIEKINNFNSNISMKEIHIIIFSFFNNFYSRPNKSVISLKKKEYLKSLKCIVNSLKNNI